MSGVEIHPLSSLEALAEVEALQRLVWQDAAIQRNLLISLVRNGAILLGAMKDNRLVGFVLGILGTESPDAKRPAMANLKLVSQRLVVLPEYRNQGIAYDLKVAQRQHAVNQGIRLITWTFDPLLSRNGNLNIRKLGAIIREYKRDYYGTEPSPQVSLGSSDRAIVEWWVSSNRVEQRINGKRSALALPQYLDAGATILNPAYSGSTGFLEPSHQINEPMSQVVLLEIPENYLDMADRQPELGKAWRQHIRELMQWALSSGYAVTDFVRGEHSGCMRSFYALTSYSTEMPSSGFSTN